MIRRFSTWFLIVVFVSISTIVDAAGWPVDVIPQGASVIARFKRPQSLLKKVAKLAGKIDPDLEQDVKDLKDPMAAMISNPRMSGIDAKGDWWVALYPQADAESAIVLAVAAKDAKKMASVLKNFQTFRYKKFVLYTKDEQLAEKIESAIKGRSGSSARLFDKTSKSIFNGSDVGVLVNVKQILRMYKRDMNIAIEEIDKALGELDSFAPRMEGVDLKPLFEMYGQLFRGTLQAALDTQSITAGVRVSARGVTLETYVQVNNGSATDNLLGKHPVSQMKMLSALPSGKTAYLGMHGDMNALIDWNMRMAAVSLRSDSATAKSVDEMIERYAALKFGTSVTILELGDLESGLLRTVKVTEVDPVYKFRELIEKAPETFAKLQFGSAASDVELKHDAETYGAYPADVMTLRIENNHKLDPSGIQRKINEMIYGRGEITSRILFLRDKIVHTVGAPSQTMDVLAKAFNSSLRAGNTSATPLARTRRLLLKEANLILLADLPELATMLLRIATETASLPLPIDADGLSELKFRRSYSGFSLATQPGGLRMKTYIPLAQIQGMYKLKTYIPLEQIQGMYKLYEMLDKPKSPNRRRNRDD